MKIELFQLNDKTARMVILCNLPWDGNNLVEIQRLYINANGERSVESGIVITPSGTGYSLSILDVHCQDVVAFYPDSEKPAVFFRIDNKFSANRTNPKRFADDIDVLWEEVTDRESSHIHDTDTYDDPLTELIRSSQIPLWLAEVFLRQIKEWKSQDLENLIRYAPDHIPPHLLEVCSIRYPKLAMKNFKHRLSPDQLVRCMIVSPMGAALYAFDELMKASSPVLHHVIENSSDVLLRLHARKLPEKVLRACAYHAPDIAFEIRGNMPPEIHAIFLSYAIENIGTFYTDANSLEDLQHEATSSLNHYREIWLTSFGGNEVRLRLTLQTFLEIDFEEETSPEKPHGCIDPFDDKYWMTGSQN